MLCPVRRRDPGSRRRKRRLASSKAFLAIRAVRTFEFWMSGSIARTKRLRSLSYEDAETIRQSFDHFLALNPDMIYAQYLTPYPKTVLRDEMLKDGLVANVDDFTKYDGFTCNTRTRHLAQSELYRCLKRQALRAYLTPSLIFRHFEKL